MMRHVKLIIRLFETAAVLVALIVLPAAGAQASTSANCSHYTYTGTNFSLCRDFPGNADRNCPDIGYQVTVSGSDPWNLDADGDHHGCDGKGSVQHPPVAVTHPTPSRTTPQPSHSVNTTSHKSAPSSSAVAGGALAVTGPPVGLIAVVGGSVLVLGVAGIFLAQRRRRVSFRS